MEQKNKAILIGTVRDEPAYDGAEKVWRTALRVERRSGAVDEIPIEIPEGVKAPEMRPGTQLSVTGRLQSAYRDDGSGRHLCHALVAERAEIPDAPPEKMAVRNLIRLGECRVEGAGRLYGARSKDVMSLTAVAQRGDGMTDLIPLVFWGKTAREAALMERGDAFCAEGRIQSRTYTKRLADGGELTREVVEVAVGALEIESE